MDELIQNALDFRTTPASFESGQRLAARIMDRSAHIGVVGMGYVGLPLAQAMAQQGFPVTGFDVDTTKVEALNAGRSYIQHIPSETISTIRTSHRFAAHIGF